MEQEVFDVVVVGAGLSGLACSVLLAEAGKTVAVLDASDRVGGRVRTDVVDGYSLDRGFQVLLTAYPACQRLLDYKALRLRAFEPGALIRNQGKFAELGDPWRRPSRALATAFSPVGTLGDKLRIAKLRRTSSSGTLEELYARASQPALQRLQSEGFSQQMIDEFFRPFLGGVFLDESLGISSRMLEFVFRMFASGDIAIPADGMAAIPTQMATRLPRGTIRLNQPVNQIDGKTLHLASGERIAARQLVIATESHAAAKLLGLETLQTGWNRTTNLYFAADAAPDTRKSLILRGDESGPVQTATVISNIAPEYAPAGKSLVSVSLSPKNDFDPSSEEPASGVREQLATWFGESVHQWRELARYDIPYSLPHSQLDPVLGSVRAADFGGQTDTFICGDHCETPSIQGAMNSGIRVAETILAT
ncbi:MAG: NAD(P)/FAD-dependent oxidoreductase [Rubripirellula sp.]